MQTLPIVAILSLKLTGACDMNRPIAPITMSKWIAETWTRGQESAWSKK